MTSGCVSGVTVSSRSRLADAVRRRRRRGGDEVQDALAAVALDDRIVAPDVVEHLWAQADVADGADPLARLRDGDAVAATRDEVVGGENLRIDRSNELGALSSDLFERRPERFGVARQRPAIVLAGFLRGGELGFRALGGG